MDPLSIIQLVMQYAPYVKMAIDIASSNEDLTTRIKEISPTLASLLESVGATLFPKAAPALHTVGGVVAAFDPNVTKWLQGSLNTLVKPPLAPALVVDGLYGPLTRDAVSKLQTQMGLKVDGLAGLITQAAISTALANIQAAIPAPKTA